MNNLKKIIICLLCAALVLGTVGCTTTTKIITDADIVGSDGRFLYTVVYDKDSKTVVEEVNNLASQLRETFQIRINRGSDEAVAQPETEGFEILIGNTNREESKTALDYLNSTRLNATNDFLIKVMGEKIVIVANSDDVLLKAVRYFTTTYAVGYAQFTPLGEGYEYIFKQEYSLSEATVAEAPLSDYVIVTPSYKSLLWSEKITSFTKLLEKNAGIKLKVVRDKNQAVEKEIVIGPTNRAESTPLKDGKWIIKVINGKLVINGADDLSIAAAMDALISLQTKCAENKEPFAITADFVLEGSYKKAEDNYYLAWNDEFNGKKLDRTIWQDYDGNDRVSTPSVMGGRTFRGDARDCFVQNGSLYIPSLRYSRVDFQHSQTSTNRTLAYQYGIVEMLVKFPEEPITTALWGMPPDYELVNGKKVAKKYAQRMEIDIVETFGKETSFAANVHNWFTSQDITGKSTAGHYSLDGGVYASQKKYIHKSDDGTTLADGYHLISMRWTPNEMVFAVDGDFFFNFNLDTYENGGDYTRQPQYFILGSAYASIGYGPQYIEDDAPLIGSIIMDYVRLYQCDTFDNVLWITPTREPYVPTLPLEEQFSLTKKDEFSSMMTDRDKYIPANR